MLTTKRALGILPAMVALLIGPARAQTGAQLSAATNRPESSTFVAGEPVVISFAASGLAPGSAVRLLLDVHGERGGVVASAEPVLNADAQGRARYSFAAPAPRLGYYEVRASLGDGTLLASQGSRPAGFITYAVVGDPAKRIDYGPDHSRFGVVGGYSTAAQVMPYLGARMYQGNNSWSQMEPTAPGQFAVDRAKAAALGRRIPAFSPPVEDVSWQGRHWTTYPVSVLSKAALPDWAMQPGTGAKTCAHFGPLSPAGAAALPSFAAAHAAAFAQDNPQTSPRYYQITWEPLTPWCFTGTPEQLVQMYALSYAPIHRADPAAIVSGPTMFLDGGSTRQLQALWAAGLGRYVDALAIHPYSAGFPPEQGGFVNSLRQQYADAQHAAGKPLRLIGTEHGLLSGKVGNLEKAEGDIRTTLIMLGEGAAFDLSFYIADFWAGHDYTKAETYGLYWNLDEQRSQGAQILGPKIEVPAYAAMTAMIDGTVSEGALPGLTGTQVGYRFRHGGRTIAVVWDYAASSRRAVARGEAVYDWMGNAVPAPPDGTAMISARPTYIISDGGGESPLVVRF